jgi:hypothetical protein
LALLQNNHEASSLAGQNVWKYCARLACLAGSDHLLMMSDAAALAASQEASRNHKLPGTSAHMSAEGLASLLLLHGRDLTCGQSLLSRPAGFCSGYGVVFGCGGR